MKQAVQVTILGQQYTVRTEAPAEEVHRVADFVNGKIAETTAGGRVVDSLDVVILTLMNVAGDHLAVLDRLPGPEAEQRLDRLVRRLEALQPGVASD